MSPFFAPPIMSLSDRSVYSSQPVPLAHEVDGFLRDARPDAIEGELLALIVPDSNLRSGGKISAEAYKLLEGREIDLVIVIAPSHDGTFDRLSICKVDEYHTPLGVVPVNDAIRNELCDEDDDIFLDDQGHYHTEGVDVQLPFLQQVLGEGFSIVPIVMGAETPALCRELGNAVGEVMYGHRALVVASADLINIEGDALGRFEKALESFDITTLLHLLGSEKIKIEGMGAVIVAVLAAQHRRANKASLLHITEPHDEHIGALACALWRE